MRRDFSFTSQPQKAINDPMLIQAHCWNRPDLAAKAVVVVAHGMAENILRYDPFFESLNDHGFIGYGHSHRGHGQTAGRVERMGYLGPGGWQAVVEDLRQLILIAKKDHPTLPLILMGHSMGSFVVRTYMTQYDDSDAIILSGTGYPSKLELIGASLVAKAELKWQGADLPSNRLNALSFGSFNKGIPGAKTPFDWLSRDDDQVQRYIDDPTCGNIHPSSFFLEMSKGLKQALYDSEPIHQGKELPVLFISGAMDPVGKYTKMVEKSFMYYKNYAFDVMMKIYPDARHELLNELNRDAVTEDLLSWMSQVVKNLGERG